MVAVASQKKDKLWTLRGKPQQTGYRLSAIGYRLSAIGYRLILGVLVSVCLLHVQIALAQTASNATYTWEVKNCSITIKSTMYYMDEFCGEKKSIKQAIKTVYKLPIGSFKATIDDSSPYAMLSCKSNALCNTVIKLNGVSNSLLCTNSDNGISFEPQNKKLKQLASAIEEEESRCSTGSSASQTNENQQRQGRQMCEAQKQTCLAACPSLRYSDGTWRIGNEASTCMSGCQSINCN